MMTPEYFERLFKMTDAEFLAYSQDMATGAKTAVASAMVKGEYVVITYTSMRAALKNMYSGDHLLRNAPPGEYILTESQLQKLLKRNRHA